MGCRVLVDELTITRLIDDPLVLRKYEYLVAKTFVHGNKLIKWCPAPGCEYAVQFPILKVSIHCPDLIVVLRSLLRGKRSLANAA